MLVARAYLAGLTNEQIGGALGCSKTRAHQLVTEVLGRARRSTLKRGQHHLIDEVLAALKASYDQNESWLIKETS